MTTIEEVLIRLGIIDQASPGVENVKKRVEGMGKDGAKWFEHVGSAGKSFHKVLEELTATSPILGNALKFALDPVAGTMMAATAAYAYFQKQIDDLNAHLDRLEEVTSRPMSNFAEASRSARMELEKTRREIDMFHKQLEHQGRRAEREDAAKNEQEASKTQQAIEEDRINKRKALEQESLKSRLSGRALAIAQYELELKYAKEIQDVRVKGAQKQLEIVSNAKAEASKEYNAAKENRELWERLASNKGQEHLAAEIDNRKQENASAEQRMSYLQERAHELQKKREESKAAGEDYQLKTGPHQETRYNMWQRLEAENQQAIIKERADILRRNSEIESMTNRFSRAGQEFEKAKEREQSATDALRQLDNATRNAVRELGKIQVTPPQPVVPIANQEARTDSFRSTVAELASSGYWTQLRAWGGRPIGRPQWHRGPFAQIAQGIMMDEANAHLANELGNFKARDFFMNRARLSRDQLGMTGALKSEEFLDDIRKDIATLKQLAATTGLRIDPANGK